MNVAAVEPENLIRDAIEAAEDIPDPLDGLVEKTATIPAHPLCPRRWRRSRR